MTSALTIYKSAERLPVPAVWISIAEANARSGIPERTLRRRCGRWQAMGLARLSGGDWRIDPTADDRFRAAPTVDAAAEVLDIREVGAGKREGANRKREIVADLKAYIRRRVSIDPVRVDRVQAIDEFVAKYGTGDDPRLLPYGVNFSRPTLYRWLEAERVAPVTGLVDKRGLSGGRREPDPEVIALFSQIWLTDTNRGSLKKAYEKISLFCDKDGKWFFGTYRTFLRWVNDTYPQAVITLNREGEQAYRRQHEPTFDQDPDAFAAGDLFVGDHHQFRAMVWHRGRLIRPWLSAWMDQRSLMFAGYVIVPDPNQCSILAAAKHACRRFGPARQWLMDNGRDYSGYALSGGWARRCYLRSGYLDRPHVSGLIRLLGSEPLFALPHSPNSKIIEGQFKILEESFGRELPNYCGATPEDRPDGFHDRMKRDLVARPADRQFPTLEAFATAVSQWIENVYHQRPSHGKYCRGRSPAETFAAHRGSIAQLADPRVLDLLDLVWSRSGKPIKVGRKGIRFQNINYGAWDPQLIAMHGQEVLVTYDPADVSSIGVWTLDHKFVCRVTNNVLHNRYDPATDEDRRAGHRLRSKLRKALTVEKELGHLRFADAAQLALAAQRHAIDAENEGRMIEAPATELPMRLVQTPLDGQSERVRTAFERPAVDAPPLPAPPLVEVDDDRAPSMPALPGLPMIEVPEESHELPEIESRDVSAIEDPLDIFKAMREVPHGS